MNDSLRIQQLRQFVLAARMKSFRAAASGTYRSQGAVSLSIRDLEESVGAALFERGRHATLTPMGERLLPLFEEVLQVHDRVLSEARQLANAERGSIKLAVAPSLAEEWLPGLLEEFGQTYPQVHLQVVDAPSHTVPGLVLAGSADLGVCGFTEAKEGLSYDPVLEDVFGVVCPSTHPLAQAQGQATWSMLRSERIIGNATSEALLATGRVERFEDVAISISNRTLLSESVLRGLGVTVLPMLGAPRHAGLAFVPLQRPRITRRIGVIKRSGRSLLPAVEAMEMLMRRNLAAFGTSLGILID